MSGPLLAIANALAAELGARPGHRAKPWAPRDSDANSARVYLTAPGRRGRATEIGYIEITRGADGVIVVHSNALTAGKAGHRDAAVAALQKLGHTAVAAGGR